MAQCLSSVRPFVYQLVPFTEVPIGNQPCTLFAREQPCVYLKFSYLILLRKFH